MTDEIDLSTCSEAELWRHVAVHLEASGIGVVLVGGAVVAIYTEGAYRSGDLHFVPERLFEDRIDACMQELGFHRSGRHYEQIAATSSSSRRRPPWDRRRPEHRAQQGIGGRVRPQDPLPHGLRVRPARELHSLRPASVSTKPSSSQRHAPWTGTGSNVGAATRGRRAERPSRT